jgi:hypothetical protein
MVMRDTLQEIYSGKIASLIASMSTLLIYFREEIGLV